MIVRIFQDLSRLFFILLIHIEHIVGFKTAYSIHCRKYFQKCRTEIIQCSFAQEAKLVWITTKHREKQLASTINTSPPPQLISAHDLYIEALVHPTAVFENVQPNELIPNRINSTLKREIHTYWMIKSNFEQFHIKLDGHTTLDIFHDITYK